tara:strand:- start:2330 stop:2719 length:390 start_codon:yes stop_codon:yes gene_type:complete
MTTTAQSAESAESQSRRDLLAQQIEEVKAVERREAELDAADSRRQRLLAQGYSDEDVDAIEAIRRGAEFAVLTAMAQCKRVWIEGGILRVEGSQAEKHESSLKYFNALHQGHPRTVAAVVFARLSGDQA